LQKNAEKPIMRRESLALNGSPQSFATMSDQIKDSEDRNEGHDDNSNDLYDAPHRSEE